MGLAIGIPSTALASSPLSGWWPFYEGNGAVAHDWSPNHNNGTVSDGATWSAGYFGSGLTFDGNTGAVSMADRAAYEPASSITVAAYVKAPSSPGNWKYIVSKGALNCVAASYGIYTGPNGGLVFYISQNGGISYSLSPDATADVWNGKWHLVVGTYDGSNVRIRAHRVQPADQQRSVRRPLRRGMPRRWRQLRGLDRRADGVDQRLELLAGPYDLPRAGAAARLHQPPAVVSQQLTLTPGLPAHRAPAAPGESDTRRGLSAGALSRAS
jgi:hypothetical protein